MEWQYIFTLIFVTISAILAVGGLVGNALSAIVWLRVQVSAKSSSAVYLAAIAINDLIYHISHILTSVYYDYRFYYYNFALHNITAFLEPLLVLGFSVERLIAISYPLQVRLCNMIYKCKKIVSIHLNGDMQ